MMTDYAPPRRLRILVAEDEALFRSMLTDILTDLGHDVVEVANGAEALKCLATEAVELVLTDLDMPFANGWDVIDAAKARHPDLPVFLVTAWGAKVSPGEGRRRPDAVLPKPLSVPCLENAIARLP